MTYFSDKLRTEVKVAAKIQRGEGTLMIRRRGEISERWSIYMRNQAYMPVMQNRPHKGVQVVQKRPHKDVQEE